MSTNSNKCTIKIGGEANIPVWIAGTNIFLITYWSLDFPPLCDGVAVWFCSSNSNSNQAAHRLLLCAPTFYMALHVWWWWCWWWWWCMEIPLGSRLSECTLIRECRGKGGCIRSEMLTDNENLAGKNTTEKTWENLLDESTEKKKNIHKLAWALHYVSRIYFYKK